MKCACGHKIEDHVITAEGTARCEGGHSVFRARCCACIKYERVYTQDEMFHIAQDRWRHTEENDVA